MDGKVVKSFQLGYVPGAFLKKYEDGDQGFLSSVDLKEMLVCVVGHVGGCLDIFIYCFHPPLRYLGFVSFTAPAEVQDTSKYIAQMDYSTDDPRQISFKEGTPLTVVEKRENGKREELTAVTAYSALVLPLFRLVAGVPQWHGGLGSSLLPHTSSHQCATRGTYTCH